MPWHERDYYREETVTRRFGGRLGAASMVTWLIGINVVVWILELILHGAVRVPWWADPFAVGSFNFELTFLHYQVWRLITYQFIHDPGGIWHILFNMVALYFFGPMLEQWLGSRRFLAFYLLCGVSGAVVMTVLSFVPNLLPGGTQAILFGASGSIFGILVADAVLFPRQQMRLIFPPILISMRTIALVFVGIAVLVVVVGGHNAGGQASHLGGALLGFVLIKNARWLDWADGLRWRLPGKRLKEGYEARRRQRRQRDEADVDRILDKVKEHGLQSLTRREKKTLTQATQRQQRSR